MLGGSSSLNGLLYIRGQREDYDDWAQLGNDGWDYDSVLPYFKKSECQERGADDYHGADGPLKVSDLRLRREIGRQPRVEERLAEKRVVVVVAACCRHARETPAGGRRQV